MADKYPHIPGIPVNIIDGNQFVALDPTGPVVAIIGTATKGPSRSEVSISTGGSGVITFGAVGSLGRGLAEAYQGGAVNAFGFRILAKPGYLDAIGDVSGSAGIKIETVPEGTEALELFSALYDARANRLRVYNVDSGVLVYDQTGAAVAVDLGLVSVTGSMALGNDAEGTLGSIGQRAAVADDESAQTYLGAAGNPDAVAIGTAQFELDAATGLNLNKLDLVNKSYVLQLLDATGAQAAEAPITAFDNASKTIDVTLTAILDNAFLAPATHSYRIVSTSDPERMDTIHQDRLNTINGAPILKTKPGSDFNGDAPRSGLLSDSGGTLLNGLLSDPTLVEVEAGKMNLYEGILNSELTLESTELDYLVFMDCYFDDLALDGQSAGDTTLPTPVIGHVDGSATTKTTVTSTIAKKPRELMLTFADATALAAATASLNAAGRGGAWLTVEEVQSGLFGQLLGSDEIARTGRILNWEASSPEVHTILALAEDAAVDLNNEYIVVPYGVDKVYRVWFSTGGLGTDPGWVGADIATYAAFDDVAVEVVIAAAAAASVVAQAVVDAITAAGGSTAVRDGDNIVVTVLEAGDILDAHDGAGAAGTGWAIAASAPGTSQLTLHFDRDMGFTVDAGGLVVAGKDINFEIYDTDLLFFHRQKEIDGEIAHFWYTSKVDPEANAFHEVNFAHRLGTMCHDLTSNETSVIGSIGVKAPSNHFNPAAIAAWVGTSPEYDEDGDVSLNGSGLLGNKFISGRGLDNSYNDANQFDAGFKGSESGEVDDTDIIKDANDFELDLGKYLSIVGTWPTMSNAADIGGVGYIASGAALYAGLLGSLAPWSGSTAKPIGGSSIGLPIKLAKRHLNSLTGSRYVMFTDTRGAATVVDGPTAALPNSDFTRNMSMRMVNDVITRLRDAGRPFIGDPLTGIRKTAMETVMQSELAALQKDSKLALESYDLVVTQTRLDKVRGTATVTVVLFIVNELRKLTINVSLTL